MGPQGSESDPCVVDIKISLVLVAPVWRLTSVLRWAREGWAETLFIRFPFIGAECLLSPHHAGFCKEISDNPP